MKKLVFLFPLFILFAFLSTNAYPQISKQDAIDLVIDSIVAGRIVKKIKPVMKENAIKVNISDLKPSVYIIHCSGDKKTRTFKFIKH